MNDFRDREVLHFYSYLVEGIEITGQNTQATWNKNSKGAWQGPAGMSLEKSDMSEVLSDLQGLEIEAYVEDVPADLTLYGLTEPHYTVILKFEDKPSQILLVGRELNTQVYVKNKDIDSVYLVNSDLLERIKRLLPEEDEEA